MKDPQIYTLVGVPRQRWSEWLRDPANPLAASVAQGRAQMAGDLMRQIATRPSGWQRLVWLLCQHFPSDYTRPGQEVRVGVSNASAAPLTSVYRDDAPVVKI